MTDLRVSDGSKSLLFQLINRLFVLPQVKLCTNQNDWNLWTMVPHLQIKIPVTRARRTRKS